MGTSTREAPRRASARDPIVLICLMALMSSSTFAQRDRNNIAPRFEDYKVTELYRGIVKPPNFGDLGRYEGTDLRCFGGNPSEYRNLTVNFAGRFIIGSCACGSGCRYLFMWDATNGRFYRIPIAPNNPGPFGIGERDPVYYKGEEYHADSSLLVIDGCEERTCNCGTRYYRWTGKGFELIAKRPSRLPSGCRQ